MKDSQKEIRNLRISARIAPTLYKRVLRLIKEKRWSVSDAVEEGLIRLTEK